MNKLSFLFLIFLTNSAPGTDKKPELLLNGSLLANPEFAHWHLKVFDQTVTSIEIVRTRNIVHEHTVDIHGETNDTWYDGKKAYLMIGHQVNPGSPTNQDSKDYYRGDFPELSFVSADSYKGTCLHHFRKCLVFVGKPHVKPYRGESDEQAQLRAVETTVYISYKSRLPLETIAGPVTTTYSYDPPPTSLLELPSHLQEIVDTENREQKEISTPHGSAFVP